MATSRKRTTPPLPLEPMTSGCVIRGLRDLVVGGDVGGGGVVRDLALGTIGVLLADDAGYILQAEAVAVELLRIGVDPHRGQGAAGNLYLPHAFDLRQLLGNDGGRGVVKIALAADGRGEVEHHDGGEGGVDLSILRVGGQVRRAGKCAPR